MPEQRGQAGVARVELPQRPIRVPRQWRAARLCQPGLESRGVLTAGTAGPPNRGIGFRRQEFAPDQVFSHRRAPRPAQHAPALDIAGTEVPGEGGPLASDSIGLEGHHHREGQDQNEECRGDDDRDLVPPGGFPEHVPGAVTFGADGLPGQVALDLLPECPGGLVAAFALFCQALQHDRFGLVVDLSVEGAGSGRLGIQDVVQRVAHAAADVVGEAFGEHLEEHHAE